MEIRDVLFSLLPVLSALAIASLVEVLVPLRRQSRRANGRLATNLWLLSFRQHPIEGVLRFGFIAATAWALGGAALRLPFQRRAEREP